MCDPHLTNVATYYPACGHSIPTNPCVHFSFVDGKNGVCHETGTYVNSMVKVESSWGWCWYCGSGR
jgi:hypothetical protein